MPFVGCCALVYFWTLRFSRIGDFWTLRLGFFGNLDLRIIQVSEFIPFDYEPVMSPMSYEGEVVKTIATLVTSGT